MTDIESGFRFSRPARIACTVGLTLAIASAGVCAPFGNRAFAASQQTLAELASLTAQVQDAAAAHEEATAKVAELDGQIDDLADEIMHIEQDVIPEQRDRASDAAANLYKMRQSSSNIVSMLFCADSLSDFITQTKYLTAVQDDNVDALNDYEQARTDLNEKLAKISATRDEVAEQEKRAAEALEQVSAARAALQQRAASEDAAEAAAARAAAAEAAKVEQQMSGGSDSASEPQQGSAEGGNSSDDAPSSDGSGSSEGAQQTPAPAPDPDPEPDSGSSSNESGWLSGVASHYGTGDGFMGGVTASGDIVTETSMGVAMLNVPLGTYVEIRYNGRSVIAVVNDRGPYVHGRVIDMQPAVARALGFLSVGVDTVQYRFL
ncbi:RlpA-like double-psi beta-barrel domain-containing protein [Collinsella tanakaei]|uniref:RlpA-like double-psi beta-barrel domain-containing protein n=1 Tax=Collinsella tanakaei TaxID=626935 RepID=UPI0025A45740|nr:RlpA-like double-psi beta-barrel domain-containing protein [Collinsella tanakaei]MDM8299739.1 RlpA-like double-psi beta-barrel domain-containing protein [Collinsella tanakaei]